MFNDAGNHGDSNTPESNANTKKKKYDVYRSLVSEEGPKKEAIGNSIYSKLKTEVANQDLGENPKKEILDKFSKAREEYKSNKGKANVKDIFQRSKASIKADIEKNPDLRKCLEDAIDPEKYLDISKLNDALNKEFGQPQSEENEAFKGKFSPDQRKNFVTNCTELVSAMESLNKLHEERAGNLEKFAKQLIEEKEINHPSARGSSEIQPEEIITNNPENSESGRISFQQGREVERQNTRPPLDVVNLVGESSETQPGGITDHNLPVAPVGESRTESRVDVSQANFADKLKKFRDAIINLKGKLNTDKIKNAFKICTRFMWKVIKGYPKRLWRSVVDEWDNHKKRGGIILGAAFATALVVPPLAPFSSAAFYGYLGYLTVVKPLTYNHYDAMKKKYGASDPAMKSAKQKLVYNNGSNCKVEFYIPNNARPREISYLIKHMAEKENISLPSLYKAEVKGLLDKKAPINNWTVEDLSGPRITGG